jgi:anaerobic selenocysteine-containing dehydrogenase
MSSSKSTTDHKVIRKWAEERGGKPATVRGTGDKDEAGVLRIDFPGYSGEGKLEEISWDEFFEKFDEKHLKFLYQDKTADGKESRFFKFVSDE